MTQYLGYVSGILIILSFVPYLRGIFRKETRPERASWLIWSLLGGIATFTQLAKGASHSLWLPALQTIGDLAIFLLAIKYGMGGLLKRDKIALAAVGLSLILWYFTQEAAVALFIVIFIDAVGAVLTILKTHEHPTTEPMSSWVLTCLAGFVGIFAVGEFDAILLAFPVYIFVANLAIIATIFFGLRRIRRTQTADPGTI